MHQYVTVLMCVCKTRHDINTISDHRCPESAADHVPDRSTGRGERCASVERTARRGEKMTVGGKGRYDRRNEDVTVYKSY